MEVAVGFLVEVCTGIGLRWCSIDLLLLASQVIMSRCYFVPRFCWKAVLTPRAVNL
jgi:hypothetical protein